MPQDTYKSSSGGRSNVEYSYDPVKGVWVPKSSTNAASSNTPESSAPPSASSQTTGSSSKATNSKSAKKNTNSKVDSKTAAEKEFIEVEFNTLQGELSVTSTEKSIRIKVGDTIKLEGVGKYLSGLYFVSAIKRTLNKDSGYGHTLSLIKTGFGGSLKKAQPENRKEEVPKETPELKVGDKVRIVGDAIYSNAHDGVKVPGWVKKETLTIDAVSADGTRVRLMPIWSWTYIKYIQKV